jgi:FdhD protein
MTRPVLTEARAPLTRSVRSVNAHGETEMISIPAERDLTIYVDKRELVTLMTLGAHPEWLVLGYLRNQRLVASLDAVESVTVDWEVNAAAVKTHAGIDRIEERTAKRVVTTGCGQGTVFGQLMDDIDSVRLPDAQLTQAQLYGIVNTIRTQESTYKSAGSVHGCALFRGEEMLLFVEDVGRHNAIDTIAGWMWLQETTLGVGAGFDKLSPNGSGADAAIPSRHSREGGNPGLPLVFYTTGRLTSEMVIKSAQMGVAIVVSRSGTTQMGYEIAERVGLCTIGRATGKHFLCYTAPERLLLQPDLAGPRLRSAGAT